MKVILQKNVANLGDAGELKDVSPGFAMNYLLPKKLVIKASTSSSRHAEHQKIMIAKKTARRLTELKEVQEKLKDFSMDIPVKVGKRKKMFGSVTSMDISRALAKFDFSIEKRKIEIGKPIKELGVREVTIKLATELPVKIKINVIPDADSLTALAQEKEEAMEEVQGSQEEELSSEEVAEASTDETSDTDAETSETLETDAETEKS